MRLFLSLTFFCLILINLVSFHSKKFTNINKNNTNINTSITFVANSETMGNGMKASTMDYFQGVQYPHLSLVIPTFDKNNQKIEIIDWQNKSIDWSTKGKLILGPVWGYTDTIDKFIDWLDTLENNQVDMANSIKFIKWNINKKYLLQLKNNSITIPNTLIIEQGSNLSFDEARALFHKKFGDLDIILKGVIDAGGFGYLHVHPDKLVKAKIHFEKLKAENKGVIIQGFIPQIYKKGEYSFVFLEGKISHFFLKVAKFNEERVQPFYGGKSFHFKKSKISNQINYIKSNFRSDLELNESEVKNAYNQAEMVYAKVLLILDNLRIPHPNYLRVDGVMVDDKFVVMELEGVEPYLEMQEAMVNDPSNDVVKNYIKSILKN